MAADFIVRRANLGDLEAVLALNEKLFALDGKFDHTLNFAFTRSEPGTAYFASRLSEEEGIGFVAEVGSRISGYLVGAISAAAFYRAAKVIAELENMLVLENYRGRGIGRALFEEFRRWAKEKKAERLHVVTIAGNKAALAFYRELGFAEYEVSLERES
jgi:GNAT superfamily N-acetyltransferase